MVSKGSDFLRNPANKTSGKFVTLSAFLELAKAKAVPGILVNIQVSNIPNFPIMLMLLATHNLYYRLHFIKNHFFS